MGVITVEHRFDPECLYSARDPYVERYWLPSFGPTALVLLRRLALDATANPTTSYDDAWLGAAVGVKASQVYSVLARLERFERALRVDETTWEVDAMIPAVDPKHYRRLPAGYDDELLTGVR